MTAALQAEAMALVDRAYAAFDSMFHGLRDELTRRQARRAAAGAPRPARSSIAAPAPAPVSSAAALNIAQAAASTKAPRDEPRNEPRNEPRSEPRRGRHGQGRAVALARGCHPVTAGREETEPAAELQAFIDHFIAAWNLHDAEQPNPRGVARPFASERRERARGGVTSRAGRGRG